MERNELPDILAMTDEEIDALAAPFEEGRWKRSEYGKPSVGRPAIFDEPMKPVTFKETPSVIAAMDRRARALGTSRSDYLRHLVAQDLALA